VKMADLFEAVPTPKKTQASSMSKTK